jgi:hypothetical protein
MQCAGERGRGPEPVGEARETSWIASCQLGDSNEATL